MGEETGRPPLGVAFFHCVGRHVSRSRIPLDTAEAVSNGILNILRLTGVCRSAPARSLATPLPPFMHGAMTATQPGKLGIEHRLLSS